MRLFCWLGLHWWDEGWLKTGVRHRFCDWCRHVQVRGPRTPWVPLPDAVPGYRVRLDRNGAVRWDGA